MNLADVSGFRETTGAQCVHAQQMVNQSLRFGALDVAEPTHEEPVTALTLHGSMSYDIGRPS